MADIRDLSIDEIKEYLILKGDKAFRAKQIWHWIWEKGARDFGQMLNIPKQTVSYLSANYSFNIAEPKYEQISTDGTIKVGFGLFDNKLIEGVLIPSGKRMTACVSSQVGCALGCTFCATAQLHFNRDLQVGEIFDQVFQLNEIAASKYATKLSNIVFMGMGEPLLNYENLMKTIDRITSDKGLGMSPSRITVSTAGVHDKIIQLADDQVKFNLAISLHSAIKETRNILMPINRKKSTLEELSNSIRYFYDKTETRPTIEYLLLGDINDDLSHAMALANWCKSFPCKVNLIEYNPTGDGKFKKSTAKQSEAFKNYLEQKNMIVNFRASKGEDIDAACGQLANKHKNKQ